MFGADIVECNKHGGVDGARDVEKSAVDALHTCDIAFVNFSCGCGIGRVLYLGPIRRRESFVGRLLRERGYRVLEALQGFSDGVEHGDVNVIVRVFPIGGKSAVLAARRVDGDGVILPECVKELDGVVGGK